MKLAEEKHSESKSKSWHSQEERIEKFKEHFKNLFGNSSKIIAAKVYYALLLKRIRLEVKNICRKTQDSFRNFYLYFDVLQKAMVSAPDVDIKFLTSSLDSWKEIYLCLLSA